MIITEPDTEPSEEWRPVSGFAKYEVSNMGRVRSYHKNKVTILSCGAGKGEYLQLRLFTGNSSYRTKKVHQLVMDEFAGPCPNGLEIRHLDGNSQNNNLNNLKYGTAKENYNDSVSHGTSMGQRKTHCKHGHKYTEKSTRWRVNKATGKKQRSCKICWG